MDFSVGAAMVLALLMVQTSATQTSPTPAPIFNPPFSCPPGCEIEFIFGPGTYPSGCKCYTGTAPPVSPTPSNSCKMPVCSVGCMPIFMGQGTCPPAMRCDILPQTSTLYTSMPGCAPTFCYPGCYNTYLFGPLGCYTECVCPTEVTSTYSNNATTNPCPPVKGGCYMVYDKGPDGCPTGCPICIPDFNATGPCPLKPCAPGCQLEYDNGLDQCPTRCDYCPTEGPSSTTSYATSTPCVQPTCPEGCYFPISLRPGECSTGPPCVCTSTGTSTSSSTATSPCPTVSCPIGCSADFEDGSGGCPSPCQCITPSESPITCPPLHCEVGCYPVYDDEGSECPTECSCLTCKDIECDEDEQCKMVDDEPRCVEKRRLKERKFTLGDLLLLLRIRLGDDDDE